MKVILIKDLKGKGKKGDVITVNDGYAANFLFPNKFAEVANSTNLNINSNAKASEQHKSDLILQEAKNTADMLKNKTITLKIKCGETGKVFGSITSREIATELDKMGVSVDKKKIELTSPIKTTGLYSINIKLHPQVHVKVQVNIEALS